MVGIYSLGQHFNEQGKTEPLQGEQISLLSRIALLSQVIDVFHKVDSRQRPGTWFNPQLVTAFETVVKVSSF